MTPSIQQQTIYDFVKDDTRSIVVEAVAGSGKTTTLLGTTAHIPAWCLVVSLAFNKNIAVELQARFPRHIQSKTFHSHSFAALSRWLPSRPRVDGDKVKQLLRDMLSDREMETYFSFCNRLVGYAKNSGIGIFTEVTDTPEWQNLIDHYAMVSTTEDFNDAKTIEIGQKVLEESNHQLHIIDFDDMLYMTLLKGCSFDKANYVLLDEAQDTNGVQLALLHRMLADNGRLIAVGDSAQAIYAFRGASADAMDEIVDDFDAVKFPLSVSYRCAKSIVKQAREYVTHIEPSESAPLGEVKTVSSYDEADFTTREVVLCRNTAPLVSLAFGFIRRGRGVRILGREIGQGLVTLVKKMKTSDVDVMLEKLELYRRREFEKLSRKGADSLAAALNDRVECIGIFADALNDNEKTIEGLIRRIETLFNDQKNGGLLTLCSVHKAKGLEWEQVNILDFDELMPSPYAKQPWQLKQERNLIYVAITRAKLNLRYITSDSWRTQSKTAEEKALDLL